MRYTPLFRSVFIVLMVGSCAMRSHAQGAKKELMKIHNLYQLLDGHYDYTDTMKSDDGATIYRFGPVPLLGLPAMFEATANAQDEVKDCGWLYLGPHTIDDLMSEGTTHKSSASTAQNKKVKTIISHFFGDPEEGNQWEFKGTIMELDYKNHEIDLIAATADDDSPGIPSSSLNFMLHFFSLDPLPSWFK